jgi:acetylornithine deacetylase/succinyl-diaminopimelate desuccinylase family protein
MLTPVGNEVSRSHVDDVLARIAEKTVLDYAQSLIRKPSVNPPGNYGEIAAWVRAEFANIGLEVQTLEGEVGRVNVIGRLRGSGDGEAICLSAHTDVVGVGDPTLWKHPPFEAELQDGALHGRGSADSKGQLAAMMAAVRAIKDAGVPLKGDLWITAPVDDETAGPMGLRHIFDTGMVKARHVIYGEATRFKIRHVYKSRLWFSVSILGRSAHGAFPHMGINAIDKAYDVIKAIRSIELRDHPIVGRDTVSVGMIQGGDQVNKVCGEAKVWFDVRWGPGRSSDEVKAAVHRALDEACARDPELAIRSIDITEEREPLDFRGDTPLVAAAAWAGKEFLGRAIDDDGGWYSSGDIFWLWKNGHIDSGIVWGPGDGELAHMIDEHISIEDLVTGARLYALAVLRVCGAA